MSFRSHGQGDGALFVFEEVLALTPVGFIWSYHKFGLQRSGTLLHEPMKLLWVRGKPEQSTCNRFQCPETEAKAADHLKNGQHEKARKETEEQICVTLLPKPGRTIFGLERKSLSFPSLFLLVRRPKLPALTLALARG